MHNQDELVKVLRKQGFEATQSSVSRDLRELGVAKAGDHYIVPTRGRRAAANPFAAVANFVHRGAHRRRLADRGQDHDRHRAERRGRDRQVRLA